jgi:hypothetical protein
VTQPLRVVLLHGQRTGSALWHATARCLHAAGVRAVAPQLPAPEHIHAPWWLAHAAGIAHGLPEDGSVVLVAHADSSVLLPAAGRFARNRDEGARVAGYVIVDGWLPRDGHSLLDLLDAADAAALRGATRDGFLPPPRPGRPSAPPPQAPPSPPVPDLQAGTGMATPDDGAAGHAAAGQADSAEAAVRAVLAAAPQVPIAFYEESVTVPDDWPDAPCGYLQLSDACAPQRAAAARCGWVAHAIAAHHLLPASAPQAVADALRGLIDALLRQPWPPHPAGTGVALT